MSNSQSPRGSTVTPPLVDAMLKRIHVVESWIAVLAFTIVVGIIMLDVIGRELVGPLLRQLGMDPGNTGIFSAQRVAIYALVVGTYTGIGIATATGSHIVPKIGDKMSPDSWGPAINRLADLTTALFLFGAAGYGWLFVNSARMLDMRAPILDWPLWMIQIFIPLGFVSAAIRYLTFCIWPAAKPQSKKLQD